MKISVLIDTYNSASFIVEAVESVLSQESAGGVQVIVVDDGSDDGTAAKLTPYLGRVTYVRQENGGQLAALNAGFSRADGDVVCLLDGDDFWLPGKLRKVTDAFARNPDVGLVHHRMTLVGRDGEVVDSEGRAHPERVSLPARPLSGDARRLLRWQGLRYLFAPCSGLAIRRRAMELVNPLPMESFRIKADAFIALPVALLFPVLYLDEPLGCFRIHGRNSTFVHADSSGARSLAYLEGVYAHANRALSRAGLPPLAPAMSWEWVKAASAVLGKRPVSLFPDALAAIGNSEALTAGEKFKAMARVGARALERSIRKPRPEPS